jgi:hypothetical protein
MKLNQVNAIITARKSETEKAVTELYKGVQKPQLFEGREKSYRPLDEDKGVKLPPESQKVAMRVDTLIKQVAQKWGDMWSLVFTQDTGNQQATAHLSVDGVVVLSDVPITTLLYLDKQVNDLETFISKLPTPDVAQEWTHDPNTGLLKTEATTTMRTSKEAQVLVKYEATKEHPAQTEVIQKDIAVGTWTQILYSGCIPTTEKEEILSKIHKLQDAIKMAKEQANMLEVDKMDARPILSFIFGNKVFN